MQLCSEGFLKNYYYSKGSCRQDCVLILLHPYVLRFLSMLEEEVYSQSSPIWDPDFMASSSRTAQLGIQTGNSREYHVKKNKYPVLKSNRMSLICANSVIIYIVLLLLCSDKMMILVHWFLFSNTQKDSM